MTDKLLMENYLLILKSTIEVYVHGTLESSNEDVRILLKNGLDNTLKHQANTYDKMTKCGWYQVNNIDSKVLKQTIKKLENN